MKIILAVAGGIAVLFIAWFISSPFQNKLSEVDSGTGIVMPQSTGLSSSEAINFSNPLGTSKSSREIAAPADSLGGQSYVSEDSQVLAEMDKKIIKNGNLTLKVDDADKAAADISVIAKSNGGEIFSSNFHQTRNNVKSGTLTIKVPFANFEKTFLEIKEVASLVTNESTSGQDVTEQYVDLQAQLKNKQAEEQSFMKILEQAQKIDDILAVTQQLSRVRGNIEQLQGRIKYIESQTDMSTISVNLSEDENITVVDSWRPLQVAKESFSALIKSLQGLIDFLIRFFIIILPIFSICGIIIFALYKVGKWIYGKIKNGKQINN